MGFIPQKFRYRVIGISPLSGYIRTANFLSYSADHAVSMAISEVSQEKYFPRVWVQGKALPAFIVLAVCEDDDRRKDGSSKAFA